MPHPKGRVNAYRRLLERHDAPEQLIQSLDQIVQVDNGIETESGNLESLDRLLFDTCLRFHFSKPFDSKQGKAHFRPDLLDHKDEGSCLDTYQSGEKFDPKIEQALRRGFDQGFAEAHRLAIEKGTSALKSRQAEIHRWRTAKIWFGPTYPGTVEPFGVTVSYRRSVPAKLRWKILERDKRRCKACGTSAEDGATLHVDHIVSVYNGGGNEESNLQTLCDICNLGKGKD